MNRRLGKACRRSLPPLQKPLRAHGGSEEVERRDHTALPATEEEEEEEEEDVLSPRRNRRLGAASDGKQRALLGKEGPEVGACCRGSGLPAEVASFVREEGRQAGRLGLWRARGPRDRPAGMAAGWWLCRRALRPRARPVNCSVQLPLIVHELFFKKLNFGMFVGLPELRNKTSLAEQSYSSWQTVDPKEMKKFQLLAHKWWDEDGQYAALHSMNDIRVPFIRDTILNMKNDHQLGSPLSGMNILDVGCGGGLLTEPLGRLGASVTGIDPLEESIRTAELHTSFDPVLAKRIQYRSCALEDIVEEASETFDIVVASEVIEHVADVETFIRCCGKVLKPEGSLFVTTINKSQLSYVFGIVVAESVLGIVPAGTHDWEKFIAPEELERLLESNGFSVKTVKGMLYNPLSGSWTWIGNTVINYALHAVKTNIQEQLDPMEAILEMGKEELQPETSIRSAS